MAISVLCLRPGLTMTALASERWTTVVAVPDAPEAASAGSAQVAAHAAPAALASGAVTVVVVELEGGIAGPSGRPQMAHS
jgi:hypothetical protein